MTRLPISRRAFLAASAGVLAGVPGSARAAVPAAELGPVLDKAYTFLKGAQKEDGSFAPPRAGEPGVAALIAAGLARSGKEPGDPVVAKALAYLEKNVKPDGGVYNAGLANYTTCLAVLAFTEANAGGKYTPAIQAATKFLRTLQYGDGDSVDDKDTKYGGAGYDKKGQRGGPDLSNTHFFVEALLAGGASKEDPQVKKALAFLNRCQNLPGEQNELAFAKAVSDDDKGGFVYNPAAAGDLKNQKRTPAGGLRSEGGMTYSGLKSFLYAGVGKDDPRVKAAVAWVRAHYTLTENPGMGQDGLFYYYHVFAKAMAALGEDKFVDAKGVAHDWRRELFDTLKGKQKADGSWANDKSRAYLENMPELATAFAVLALTYCK